MIDEGVLSKREEQIARNYIAGASYKEIAETLCIAPSTVRTHLAAIYRKLEVSSKVELAQRLRGNVAAKRSHTDTNALLSELALTLEEALQREKSLSEVLRIISASHGNLDEVMPAILGYALVLCNAELGALFEHRGNAHFVMRYTQGFPAKFHAWLKSQGMFAPGPETELGRMARQRDIVNIMDVKSESVYLRGDPLRDATVDLGGARSFVAIPMVAGDRLVGAFTIYRQTLRPFSQDALRLAQIFATQSVIAWENARLISESRS